MTTICTEDNVSFPGYRAEQAADLMSLAGDALIRGDRVAWAVLYRASKELEGMPEYNTDAGRAMCADFDQMYTTALRKH